MHGAAQRVTLTQGSPESLEQFLKAYRLLQKLSLDLFVGTLAAAKRRQPAAWRYVLELLVPPVNLLLTI